MKTWLLFSFVAIWAVGLTSCNKTSVDPSLDGSARSSSVVSSSLTGPFSLTAVDMANLPTAISTYITTNYVGATIKEARKDGQGNFIVAITVNSVLKLLLFKADGTFIKEASLRPGHASGDSTHHPRSGAGFTDVAVSSLPAAITTYITTNYVGATINKAAQDKNTTDYIIAITTSDKKRVLLLFGADGTFKKVLTR